jgi:ADP-L-glycero-D-manno-heptose 6-epimerase
MIVVTGGAGFIGSAVAWELNNRGRSDIVIVDELGESEKWRNLVPLQYEDYLHKDAFLAALESNRFGSRIEAIIHLGACSSTTERNADYLAENNYRYTFRLATWRESHPAVRFIYASSAATYGAGEQGYRDDESLLTRLRPLNMYGYSKHMFDLVAHKKGWLRSIVGLKYFNVFGPNEYHKGDMRSVINKAYPSVRDSGVMRLFKSHRAEYRDGEQVRDFIYVRDAVAMTLFFLDNSRANGIFNVGVGRPRSWNDVAAALFRAAGIQGAIEYVPMPERLREKYQYYTCADMTRLRQAGCEHQCMTLEAAVEEYVTTYLRRNACLGETL